MRSNSKKDAFLKKFSEGNVEGGIDCSNIHKLMRINFNFFTSDQGPASSFDDLDKDELVKLLAKFINFSDKSLLDWSNETAGGHSLYVNYRRFPRNTDFKHPLSVPYDVCWSRFRVGSKLRVVGFVVPDSFHGVNKDGFLYDKNTFYVVFIDKEHRFYKTEKR